MVLSDYQIMVASSPFRYPGKDVYDVMVLLGDRGNWEYFQGGIHGILFDLQKAAVSRGIQIPGNFALILSEVNLNPSVYSRR